LLNSTSKYMWQGRSDVSTWGTHKTQISTSGMQRQGGCMYVLAPSAIACHVCMSRRWIHSFDVVTFAIHSQGCDCDRVCGGARKPWAQCKRWQQVTVETQHVKSLGIKTGDSSTCTASVQAHSSIHPRTHARTHLIHVTAGRIALQHPAPHLLHPHSATHRSAAHTPFTLLPQPAAVPCSCFCHHGAQCCHHISAFACNCCLSAQVLREWRSLLLPTAWPLLK
jgi:hypothetical protein